MRSPKLVASALSLMAPLGLSRLAAVADAAPSQPLAPVGSVPSPPAGSVPNGQLPNGTPIQLSVVLRSSDAGGLEATARAVSTPGSSQYRHYLTPAQVQQRFGPPAGVTAAVDAYLSSHGLTLGPTVADGLVITATGTAGTVSGALHTGIMTYRERSGRITYRNTAQPQLPSAIAPQVAVVTGLDNSAQLQPHVKLPSSQPGSPATLPGSGTPAPRAVFGAATPCPAASNAGSAFTGYTADQLASSYGFASSYQSGLFGRGVTVALFELVGYSRQDLSQFERCYGIRTSVKTRKVSGGARIGSETIESELDIEGVVSLAPKAKVLVYEAPNSDSGVVAAYGAIASDNRAQVVSTSWGTCEPQSLSLISAENTAFEEMAAQGQSVVAAAGDSGSEDCLGTGGSSSLKVDDPGSQPWVTGVGGTDLTSAGFPPVEAVWNDGTGAGGGGISQFWQMPSWQAAPGVRNAYSTGAICGVVLTDCREVPDVAASASANNGYVIYCSAGSICKKIGRPWFAVGGTSAAAPLWAALLAVADQGLSSPIGFADPSLYAIAANSSTRNAFNDITAGDNDFTGTNGGRYPATSGFDLATGLGSPNGSALIPLLRG